MRVKQVAVPMDFGVENMGSPNHVNVSLLVANDRVVKANSLVLSYNSRVFKKMFKEDELCKSVDLTEFPRHVVDKFVKTLYSGKVDFQRLPFTREIWQLADNFNVKWLLKQFDLNLRYLIEERMHKPTFINIKYIFEEANYFKIKKRRHDYMVMATNKLNDLYNTGRVKKKFIERYVSKHVILNTDQINLLVDFAGEDGGNLLLKVICKKMARNNYSTMDRGSRRLLRRINLAQCLESDMDSYVAVFGNKDKYRNLSPEQVDELRRLEENSTTRAFRDRPDLRDAFVKKKRRLIGQHSHTHHDDEFPTTSSTASRVATLDDVVSQVMSISNSRLRRKRSAPVINITVKRPRPDLHYGDNSGDLDDDTVVQLLDGTDQIPNIVFSFPDELETFQTINRSQLQYPSSRYRAAYTFDDVVKFFMTSSFSFKNMYMFIEYIFIRKAVTLRPLEPSDAEMVQYRQYINNILAIKLRHDWKKISKEFVKDILRKLINGPMKSLLGLICENEELTSTRDAFEIISWRGVRSNLRTRKYYDYDTIRMGEFIFGDIKKYKFFWKHPATHPTQECSKPGRCGFVLCVVPISKSFNIRLSTRPEDYSEEIHCHPELLNAENMHVVLRRDYSTKGKSEIDSQRSHMVHVTWKSKPVYYKNHVHWCGESIPDNAYIALIVYYSIGALGPTNGQQLNDTIQNVGGFVYDNRFKC